MGLRQSALDCVRQKGRLIVTGNYDRNERYVGFFYHFACCDFNGGVEKDSPIRLRQYPVGGTLIFQPPNHRTKLGYAAIRL